MAKMLPTLSYGAAQPSIMARGYRNRALTPAELEAVRRGHREEIASWEAKSAEDIAKDMEGRVLPFVGDRLAEAEALRGRMLAHHRKCLAYWEASSGW